MKAIAVPVIGAHAETRVVPVSPARALRELAPSTLFQLPGQGEASIRAIADVARSVPSYTLEVGSDPSQVAGALNEILAR